MKDEKYAQANIHAKTPAGKRARMAYTAQGTHGKGKTTMKDSGDKRTLGQKLYQMG